MQTKTLMRKGLTFLLASSATLSIGFLAIAGMFVLSPSLILCSGAFVLAAAYEGQVNTESISGALRRMFDPNYLKRGIIRRFLEEQIEKRISNAFKSSASKKEKKIMLGNTLLDDYFKQKQTIEQRVGKFQEDFANPKSLRAAAKRRLRKLEMFVLNELSRPTPNAIIDALLNEDQKAALSKEIKIKSWLISTNWIFAIGGGIACFFATLNAMHVAVSIFALSSVIAPGGLLIGLAVAAGIGYTLLLYQAFSDMVQEFTGKWKEYFHRRQDSETKELESKLYYGLRMAGTVIAIGLAAFVTVATAGTWWYAAKLGAGSLGITNRISEILRTISIALMALPTFTFGASNSVASIDYISRNSYKKLFYATLNAIRKAWENENIIQFINPFRLTAKLLALTAGTILFVGHLLATAVGPDFVDGISPAIVAAFNMLSEFLEDLPYLYGNKCQHGHNHNPKILEILFYPVTYTIRALSYFAAAYDVLFTRSWSTSTARMLPQIHEHSHGHGHSHGGDHNHESPRGHNVRIPNSRHVPAHDGPHGHAHGDGYAHHHGNACKHDHHGHAHHNGTSAGSAGAAGSHAHNRNLLLPAPAAGLHGHDAKPATAATPAPAGCRVG